MCWASGRQTSRSEDIAYCLLGLFDVNMPLLYGEGTTQAFLRLQHQIIAHSADETLFAWTANEQYERRGMLARSPEEFAKCEHIYRHTFMMKRPRHIVMGNGLEFPISLAWDPLWPKFGLRSSFRMYEVPLACELREPGRAPQAVSIELHPDARGQSWFRTNASTLRFHKALRVFQAMESIYRGYSPIHVPEFRTPEEVRFESKLDTVPIGFRVLQKLFPGMVELAVVLIGITSILECRIRTAYPNHHMLTVWIMAAFGWKVSGYRFRYLCIIAAPMWLYGFGDVYGIHALLVLELTMAAYLEATHIAN